MMCLTALLKIKKEKKTVQITPPVLNLLLIDRNKQEVLFEDVDVSCPCLHALVPPLSLTAEYKQK